jgi:hypothetical protein
MVELPLADGGTDARCAARPIVYLDRNQWSTLAATRLDHRGVSSGVKRAAERLIELVEGGWLLVPASSAHFTETVRLYAKSASRSPRPSFKSAAIGRCAIREPRPARPARADAQASGSA